MTEQKQTLRGTLNDIIGDYEALWELYNDEDGDLTDNEKIFDLFLEELLKDFESKLEGCANVIDKAKYDAMRVRNEVKRLQSRAQAYENKGKRLLALVKFGMERTGRTKVKTLLHTFSIQASGGRRKLDILIPPTELPKHYRRTVIEADTDAIRAALDAGATIEGVVRRDRGNHLRIR
jgi:hypothetical protein